MTPDASQPMTNDNEPKPKLSLGELLQRAMDDDDVVVAPRREREDRERWDEDEGSFGG